MLISIIVPVYNSEKYIVQCVQSILNQTFQDFELILVDDGSTDRSQVLLSSLLSSFPQKISYFFKKNEGVSSARNYGLRQARGKYVSFIDSDDYICEDFLQRLVTAAEEDDIDLVMSGISFFDKETNIIERKQLPEQKNLCKNSKDWFEIASMDLITSPVSKLYKTSLLKKSGLFFDESKSLGEDRDFNVKYLSLINNAVSISSSSYMYRRDVANSLTRKYHKERFFDDIDYWNKLKNLLEQKSSLEDSKDYLAKRLFWFIIDDLLEKWKKEGFIKMIESFLQSRKLFNRNFLISNIKDIEAPKWQKLMVLLCYR